jgi:hypothetical protein
LPLLAGRNVTNEDQLASDFRNADVRRFTVIDTTALLQERCRTVGSRLGGTDSDVHHCHLLSSGLEQLAETVEPPHLP